MDSNNSIASINFHSVEWASVYRYAQDQIRDSMKSLCSPSCPPERVRELQGKIEAFRSVIAHDKVRYKDFKINPFY